MPLQLVSASSRHGVLAGANATPTLLHAIEERATRRGCFVPDGYRPSDQALATLGNCALDLPPEKLIDGTQVKSLRQRLRAKGTSGEGSR